MKWDDLPVFLAVVDAGSLLGAARQLGVNHSTVFRRLNALESDLGVRLFDRQPTGYVLTPAGERMRDLVREADAAVASIHREVAGRDRAAAGKVRLTTAPNLARTLVPGVLRALRRDHPRIVVEVAVGDSDYDLARREADLALRATTRPPEHLVGRKLMDLEWRVCGARTIRGHRRPRRYEDLAGLPLVGADAALMRLDAFQRLESDHGGHIVARASDLSTMAALTLAGVGYSLLPSDQNEAGLEPLFALPDLGGELWLLTHPDLRRVRRIDVVWQALVAATT